MIETLLNIRPVLVDGIECVADIDIHMMTNNELPKSSRFPAIGLKDGDEDWKLVGGTLNPADSVGQRGEFDKALIIKVFAFVQIFDVEDIMTGEGESDGILELAANIITTLNGHDLGDTYTAPLVIRRSTASQTYVSRNEGDEVDEIFIQMKELTFTCSRQVLT